MVKETISSFGDAKCFPVRAVSFREGKNEMCFVLTSLFHFFTTRSFRQAIRLDFSITSYFIMFFNDHLYLIDLHFSCRCLFTMKRTHIRSPKKRTTLLEVFLYIYLCCKTSGHATHPRYYAQLPWAEKPKKTLRSSSRKPMVVFVFRCAIKKFGYQQNTSWYQLIHKNPAWFWGCLKFEKLISNLWKSWNNLTNSTFFAPLTPPRTRKKNVCLSKLLSDTSMVSILRLVQVGFV